MKELTLCVWCVQKGARHCVTCEVGGNCVWCVDKSAPHCVIHVLWDSLVMRQSVFCMCLQWPRQMIYSWNSQVVRQREWESKQSVRVTVCVCNVCVCVCVCVCVMCAGRFYWILQCSVWACVCLMCAGKYTSLCDVCRKVHLSVCCVQESTPLCVMCGAMEYSCGKSSLTASSHIQEWQTHRPERRSKMVCTLWLSG